MASNLTVMGNKEILLVAENIAHEKGIAPQEVINAMAEGIKAAAKKKYGQNLSIDCQIDKKKKCSKSILFLDFTQCFQNILAL